MQKLIIDVSEHQAKINWEAVKPHIDGAIIRCGYGDDEAGQDDKWWSYNVKECERLGIPYGVYLYSYADSVAHANSEVAHAKRLLKGHKPQYPVYIDLEEPRYGAFAKKAADIFCKAMKEAGYIPGFYTYQSFYDEFMSGYAAYTLWIASYADPDVGKPTAKPYISAKYDAWQYTSHGYVSGYDGRLDVSYFYKEWTSVKPEPKPAQPTTTIKRGQVAADIHKRMVNDNRFGYSWAERWGANKETWTVDGVTFPIKVGDYDCSSSCIEAWADALTGTKYADMIRKATYTGNMRDVFVGSGLFEWKPISFIASPGDLYLNESDHVAMCQRQVPDELSEFSISETGGTTGKRGDQTGHEAAVNPYYDYPWDGILHYNGKADTAASSTTQAQTSQKLAVDGVLGKLTISELQRQLGVNVSGKMDKATIKALQRKLGVKVDGIYGTQTKKALQKMLGVKQDGYVGAITVKALQRALNAGKLK